MGITAGFLAQATLKFLLEFGDLSIVIGYNARKDFFQIYSLLPSLDCKDKHCLSRQKDIEKVPESERFLNRRDKLVNPKVVEENKREQNEWGIEIVASNDVEEVKDVQKQESVNAEAKEANLEDLMSKFNKM